MAETKIKAAQFHGVVGHGTDGYFLMTNADGSMSWAEGGATGPSVTSVAYPGDDLAADPAGAQTVVLTGTNFGSSMSVSIGGTTAPSVAHDSSTQLTITTPAKAAGDYDIVVTNTVTGASGTFVNGISYNGVPTWTTATGSLGTFESETTISTITLAATEPDGGTITFNITNGALPTGLSLTGANIDGTTTAESSTTLYSFTIEAIDDENQATPRNFSITVNSSEIVPSQNFTINTYEGTGSTQSIEGKIGTAASFDGSSYITTSLDFDTLTDYSISMWIYIPATLSDSTFFAGTISSGGLNGIYFLINTNNTIRWYERSASTSITTITSTDAITVGSWNNFVAVRDGGTNYLYVNNGTAVSASNATITHTSGFTFGRAGDLTTRPLNGKIDQVRVFGKALSSSEVTTLYGESNTSTTKSTTDIFDDGSGVALYEFEEGAKDTGGVNGYIGSAGVFNGSSSRITLPKLSTITADVTVSGWLNLGNTTTSNRIRFLEINLDSNGYAGPLMVLYKPSNGEWKARVGNGTSSNSNVLTHTYTLTQSTWYHVCFTRNDSTNVTKFYVNGALQHTETVTATSSYPSNATSVIGDINYTTPLNYNWLGSIDQVRIFNKAISSSEVTTLYQETSASSTKSTTDIFDDGSGVALYELEGNANDSGKYGSGVIDDGQSAVFNGSSYISRSNSFLPTGNSSRTFSFWTKLDTHSNDAYFMSYGNGANGQFFSPRVTPTSQGGYISFMGYAADLNSNVVMTTGEWMHLCYTYDGTTLKIYKNATEIASGNLSLNTATTYDFIIGARNFDGSITRQIDGQIDQVRIYSSALSASDVEALASETNVPTTNLIAHYKLDGDATDEIASNDGTWSGTEAYSDPAEYPNYNGTATNVTYSYDGTPTNVSFVGTSFQPDLVWIKARSGTYGSNPHRLQDSVRGDFYLSTSSAAGEQSVTQGVQSYHTNGFTVGSGNSYNGTGTDFVAWCWKAGGAAVSNTDGTITSQVSANQDAGFSIINYNGNGTSGATIGHGLSQAPEMIIIKRLNDISHWRVGTNATGTLITGYFLTNALAVDTSAFQSFDSTTFTLGSSNDVNTPNANDNYIAYCFHSVDSYQKVGTFDGTGNNTGNIVTTGFKPRFLMWKSTSTGNWQIVDSVRSPLDDKRNQLYANLGQGEDVTSYDIVDFNDDGFQMVQQYSNKINETYIYLAIA